MASSQQNNYFSIPQQPLLAQAAAAGNNGRGGASPSMAPTLTAPAADGANLGNYSVESIHVQQAGQAYAACAATAAIMGTNDSSWLGGGVSAAVQQPPVQTGGAHAPPTAAAVPEIPAQYISIGGSVPAPAPALLATSPNEQLMVLMAATAAVQQTKAQQQPDSTIVATAADQQQGFTGRLADQGSVIAAAFGNVMAPQIPQQIQHVQCERGSQIMEGTTATIEDTEAPASCMGQQPSYVNAKQHKRILKRREERALIEEMYSIKRQRLQKQKASSEGPGQGEIKSSSGKGYKYESRHLLAKKRPRDKTGRFLTKEELVEYYKEHPEEDPKRLKNDGGGQMMEE